MQFILVCRCLTHHDFICCWLVLCTYLVACCYECCLADCRRAAWILAYLSIFAVALWLYPYWFAPLPWWNGEWRKRSEEKRVEKKMREERKSFLSSLKPKEQRTRKATMGYLCWQADCTYGLGSSRATSRAFLEAPRSGCRWKFAGRKKATNHPL